MGKAADMIKWVTLNGDWHQRTSGMGLESAHQACFVALSLLLVPGIRTTLG